MGETKQLTGLSQGVTEKPSGWTEFAIETGGQYPLKVSTKIPELIEMGRAATNGQQIATWTYEESDGNPNPHKPGTFYKNRMLQRVEVGSGVEPYDPLKAEPAGTQNVAMTHDPGTVANRVATPAAAPKDSLSKDEWARKDSAADKRACIAIAVSALTHTMPADPTPEDLTKFIGRVKFLSHEWHVQVEAVRGGSYADDDIPF